MVWVGASCDLTELDLLKDPNNPSPEAANVNDLYNSVQLAFEEFVADSWYETSSMARMVSNTGSYFYVDTYQAVDFNDIWNDAYSAMFPDIDALLALAEDRGLDIHAGSSKIMKAYTLMALADMFGSVPNSEALQGIDAISPVSDPGDVVYSAAYDLLDEAIEQLTGTNAPAPTADIFYDGDAAKWLTLAKTLQFRAAVTTRGSGGFGSVSPSAEVARLLSDGDLIDDAGEDWQFNYGNNRNNPNARHPLYNNSYETADGDYMSTYYMWLLRGEKVDDEGIALVDPRIRYYFYRQTENSGNSDPNNYSCHFSILPDQSAQPAHYADIDPDLPYCIASEDGYWGRDHMNNEGIPPDGPLRTVYGLYPMGGQFDDNSFEFTQALGTTGGLGQGIQPLMLSSFVDFLRAEAALTLGTGEDPRELLESGIRKSMAKVISFSDLVPATFAREIDNRGDIATVEELYKPEEKDVDDYVQFVLDRYDAADDKLDVVMKEYYIALWGNGLEAYNMYRRTGKPNNMAPALEPGNTDFITLFFLPAEHVNLNQNATQQSHTDDPFWMDPAVKATLY